MYRRLGTPWPRNRFHRFGQPPGGGFAAVVRSKLTASWQFENNGNDTHTNNLHLTEVNSPTYQSGLIGNALKLNRVAGQYLYRDSEALLQCGQHDWSWWFAYYRPTADRPVAHDIASRWGGGGGFETWREFYIVVGQAANGITFFTRDPTAGVNNNLTQPSDLNDQWVLVVAKYKHSTRTMTLKTNDVGATLVSANDINPASPNPRLIVGGRMVGGVDTPASDILHDSYWFFQNYHTTDAEDTWWYNSGNGRPY